VWETACQLSGALVSLEIVSPSLSTHHASTSRKRKIDLPLRATLRRDPEWRSKQVQES
jgi:hypothetical protein